MTIDTDYLTEFLVGLLNTPSPTGDTEAAIAYTEQALLALGLETWRTRKGALLATLAGVSDTEPRTVPCPSALTVTPSPSMAFHA